MKMTKQYLSAVFAVLVIAGALFLVLSLAAPAFSAGGLAALIAARAPTPVPCEPIPLKPVTDLKSLDATVNIDVNGKIDGKRTQGNLKGLLTTNDQDKSKISISGSLLGDIATQVGGSVVGLFTPSRVDVYKMPDGAYIVLNSLVPVCVKPTVDKKASEALEDVSPEGLLSMLTSEDVACGTFVGDETLNGMAVKHYVIDGDAFLAAAQASDDPRLKAFGDALWSAEDADLFIDARTGYPVAFSGDYSGEFEPLQFEGDFGVDLEVTGVNNNTPVKLPASCNNPISK